MQKIRVELTGVPGVAMLTHNERLANPTDPIARAMKAISSKRKKTDDDLIELARLEMEGGMYLTEDGAAGIPSWNVYRCIQEGGKLNRLGKAIERSIQILSPDVVPIVHSGPQLNGEALIAAMWNGNHYDQRSVKVGQAKVTRTRPMFRNWSVEVEFLLVTEVLNLADFTMAVENAGLMSGLGDYRPRFGRFDAQVVTL